MSRGKPLADRLLAKTDREYGDVPAHRPELGPCWPWLGALNSDGYGEIRRGGPKGGPVLLAHRAALELALGRPLEDGKFANHRCDEKRCVRPRHLYEGTPTENVHDMVARGRLRGAVKAYGKRAVAIALAVQEREDGFDAEEAI